jgi:NADH-quinone oxidoreductase subunit G
MMQLLTKNDGAQWQHFDDVVTDMCKAYPEFTPIKEIPNASFRIYNEKISRQTHRFSGRTSMNANKAVSEPRPPQDLDSPLNFSMEGYKGIPPAPLIPFYWSPGWNSVQAVNKYLDEPAGSNKDGNSGIRLFDNKLPGDPEFFTNIPDIQPLEQDDWYLVPVYQIFGSEELSSKGKAIGERISEPFIIMNKSDIEKSGLNENERYRIKIQSYDIEFTLRSDERIPERVAGISVDLPGVPFINASVVSKLQFIKTSIK